MDKKVSVLIITYNHEKYIVQAVESALQQEVTFPYEIVIGEDCSTDRTRAILTELSRAHPDRIRLLLRDSKGEGLPGKINFVNTLEACQGEYVALLDGDDYWTDARKLQKQVDFLEAHPDYSFCFHNAKIVSNDEPSGPETFCSPTQKETLTFEDLLQANFIFTGSTMFRRGLFGKLPDWFFQAQTGDWALHMLNSQYGKIGYLNQVMAVYRVHGGGWWSSKRDSPRLLDQARVLENINAHLGFRHDKQIKAVQYRAYADLAEMAYQQGDLTSARTYLSKCLRLGLAIHRLPSAAQLGRLLKLQNSTLCKLINSVQNRADTPRL